MGQPGSKQQPPPQKWTGAPASTVGGAYPGRRSDGSSKAPAQQTTDVALIDELQQQGKAASASPQGGGVPVQGGVPIVVRFKGQPTKQVPGGPPTRQAPKDVKVAFEYNQFRQVALSRSGDDFFAVMYVPPGTHNVKFRVDGVETVDPSQPISAAGFNVIHANPDLLTAKEEDEGTLDDPSQWGQAQIAFEETRKFPAILPPHLRYTPLNAPPTQFRCDADGTMTPVPESSERDALPLPLGVTVNHVYFQRREDHMVVGTTTRFRNKFVSVIYYRGVEGGVPVNRPSVASMSPVA
jgi:hypothetical protein